MDATSALAGPCKDTTRSHYRTFDNIFLYVTERCQLRCGHCYMGKRHDRAFSMSLPQATSILTCCRKLGASNLTLLGGEPTLHRDLTSIVAHAREVGYETINIDTNGLLWSRICNIAPGHLKHVRVSLDGASEATHDLVRGRGMFKKTVNSINALVQRRYNVAITSTIFSFNIGEAEKLLELAQELGVRLVNFHVFTEEGNGRSKSHWSTPREIWVEFCAFIDRVKDTYNLSIWYPPAWATRQGLNKYVEAGYRGCLGCSLDRLSIFPDGTCYVCSLLFDECINFGTIKDGTFRLNKGPNEFELFTNAVIESPVPQLSGCPAEARLKRGTSSSDSELVSICRCWKSQA